MEELRCLILFCSFALALTKLVSTPSGPVRGKAVEFDKDVVYQFLGIPYAKSPVGELRFRKPQPYGSWDFTLDATKHPPSCIQTIDPFFLKLLPNQDISEDCLFLNMYIPRGISLSNNKAVMIWIHGGGYFTGQASMYDGSELAMKGDVIVVTINYRIGILGFLTTGDAASPGNYGLWDQRLAIEWVRSNIAAFGGNPSSITIFGQSAGGMSVVYQSMIPYNRGLFQRAIAQSGEANMFSLKTAKHKRTTQIVRNLSGCGEYENPFTFVECLRHLSTDEIANLTNMAFFEHVSNREFSVFIGPAIDGELFKGDPPELLKDADSEACKFFQSIDLISGTTDGEGTVFLLVLGLGDPSLGINVTEGLPSKALCDIIAPAASEAFYENSSAVSKAVCEKYSLPNGDTTNIEKQSEQIVDFIGDILFVSPNTKTLIEHAHGRSSSKTYQYIFSASAPFHHGVPTPWYKKAVHGADILYMFSAKMMFSNLNGTYTEQEERLTERMITYWSNFAKTGNPNGDGLPFWPQFDINDKAYVNLDLTVSAGTNLFQDRINFIQKELPELLEREKLKNAVREEL